MSAPRPPVSSPGARWRALPALWWGLVATAGLLVGLALQGCGGPTGALDVHTYPAEQQANYRVFENRCSRCHDLVRPLAARVGQGGWEAYVTRMSRHPGAGIGHADQQAIAAFLEFYHAQPSAPIEEGAL